MLTHATYDGQSTQMNCVVYSQLEVAIIGGTAYHLIKQHNDNNNEYEAWNDLCDWYDGDEVNNEISYFLRPKLESYGITLVSNAAQ